MRKSFVPAYGSTPDAPISDLNTTPLIDVMLVLLIMFIITIPVATHKVTQDLPQGPPPVVNKEPVVHRLELDAAGRISLDAVPVAPGELRAKLAAIAAEPRADLLLRADGEALYVRFDEVMATVKRAGITRLGMIDNQRHIAALK
ncbi:MAG TPA: biopolymer transporter ExbD [Allosphingosinicella sp.]|uniref:ExbD/TolR family protein n=1 Tax=Allosphingosinicella sp. TaxID=2823234 RepID=UPI002EDBA0D9